VRARDVENTKVNMRSKANTTNEEQKVMEGGMGSKESKSCTVLRMLVKMAK